MNPILFFVCAALALAGALGVVLARNPVHAALSLLLTLVTTAVFFLAQDAQLVAIVQIVVYASAVVVLFLFVITLLGVDRHEATVDRRSPQLWVALAVGALLLVQVLLLAGNEWATGQHSARGALDDGDGDNVRRLAESLFTDFLWPFEITAALLVIAVVGGVVLARRSRRSTPSEPR